MNLKDWDLSLLGIIRDSGKNVLQKPLSDIKAKTLVIWGEKDSWIDLTKGMQINAEIENSSLRIIKNSGHLPMEENPELFNEILIEFLKG